MSPLARLPTALRAYKDAEERLGDAVAKAYPIGAIVAATLGNSRVTGPVKSHGSVGYYRGYITIENERTGKERSFYAADRSLHNVEVIEYPGVESGVLRSEEKP